MNIPAEVTTYRNAAAEARRLYGPGEDYIAASNRSLDAFNALIGYLNETDAEFRNDGTRFSKGGAGFEELVQHVERWCERRWPSPKAPVYISAPWRLDDFADIFDRREVSA